MQSTAADAAPTPKRRRRTWILGIVAVLVVVWAVYRVNVTRFVPTPMVADTSCQTVASTVAELSQLTPGGPSIRCASWDIGTGVTGYVWRAPAPRASLLLMHGFGDYAQRYVQQNDRLIPQLLSMGISVYAFDMWGSGRSPGQRGVTDLGQAIDDHLAARRAIRADPQAQGRPIFLLAHAIGGLVTATSVLRDQSDLAGVVLLAPGLKYDVGLSLRILAQVGGFLVPTLNPSATADMNDLTRIPGAQQLLAHDPLMVMSGMPFMTLAGVAGISNENWGRYPAVSVPVLAVHGTADKATDPNGSREFVAAVSSADKTLHLVEGGRHALLDDAVQDEALGVILAWLDKRIPVTAAHRG